MYKLNKLSHFKAAYELKKIVPQLKNVNTLDIEDALREHDMFIIQEKEVKTSLLVRLTVIPCLLVMIFLFLTSPLRYILTGKWKMNTKKNIFWINWFRSFDF